MMMSRFKFSACCVLLGLAVRIPTAQAELVTYDVNIIESGPVTVGSTINWEVFATISESTANNFGIATASVTLKDSFGSTLTPSTVGSSFSGYTFSSGGTFDAPSGELRFIGAFALNQGPSTVGADPANGGTLGPFLLATGSYAVNQVGLNTLSAIFDPNLDDNTFFTAAGQENALASDFTVVLGSDTIMVNANAVPEPSSLAMLGLGACAAWGFRRRRRKNANLARSQTAKPEGRKVKKSSE